MKQIYFFINQSKILIIGFIFILSSQLAYGQDGTIDTSFNPGTGFNNWVFSSATQADGKIIVGGIFTSFNGTTVNRIARLNTDGSLGSFNQGTGFNDEVYSTVIQSDGKIIAGGQFTSYNQVSRNNLARLNADGTLDNTFGVGNGFNERIFSVALQSDEKIIAAGGFTSFNGATQNRIIRLNSDGLIDNSFAIGSGFNNWIYTLAVQTDGKILVGGQFTLFNGTTINGIARLNTNGSLDATFNPGLGTNNGVYSISIQSDGKIIIGGMFTTFNNVSRNRIARLNTDGSLDTSFNPDMGFNGNVWGVTYQNDGKIYAAGDYTMFNGTSSSRITRLNTNGTLDATFNSGTGIDSFVNSVVIQPNGYILLGGGFNTYNGTPRKNIVRIIATSLNVLENQLLEITMYPNPTENNLHIKSNFSVDTITISNMFGQEVKSISINSNESFINLQDLTAAIYFVKVTSNGITESFKIIKK